MMNGSELWGSCLSLACVLAYLSGRPAQTGVVRMTGNAWIQLLLYLGVLVALVEAAGLVHGPRVSRASRAGWTACWAGWSAASIASLASIRSSEMGWRQYAVAVLVFNASGLLGGVRAAATAGHRCRSIRRSLRPIRPTLAFNTAVSFATNTNWQSYGGETTMSYLSQMLGLTVQNFVSAATGMAVLVALIRGLARRSADTIGNFWVDLARSTLYILLPLSLVLALAAGVAGCRAELQALPRRASWSNPIAGADGEPVTDADAGDGAGRVADRDQATRHQRRRVLQRQLGASVRESDAAVELPRSAGDPADLRRRCATRSA